jgi:hypothetical protein
MRGILIKALGSLAVVVALAAAGCGGDESGDISIDRETSAAEMAETGYVDGLESGEGGLNVFINRPKWGSMSVTVSGEFEDLADESLPLLQAYASSEAQVGKRNFEFNGRLFLSPEHALFVYGPAFKELGYKPRPPDFRRLKARFEAVQGEGGEGDVLACLDVVRGLKPSDLIRDVVREGRRELAENTNMFLLGAHIRVNHFVDLLIEMAEDPACSAQLEAVGLPPVAELEAFKADLTKTVKDRSITVALDTNGIVRYVVGRVAFIAPPGEEVEVRIRGWVNKPDEPIVKVDASEGKPWSILLRKFGVKPADVLAAGGDELLIGFLRGLSTGLLTGRS